MVSPVISKIVAMQQSFTVSENEIAQYVINNADAVVASTITTIAQNTNTSEASINRFCKKIGFKGFNAFKIALAQENFFNSMRESDAASSDGLVGAISRDYRNMLVNTTAMLDEQLVQRAAAAMRKAAHIYIFSPSYACFVAEDLEFRLSMVGLYAKSVKAVSDLRIFSRCVGKEDLILIIAPSLLTRELYQSINICHEKGASIISITSYDSPKLTELIDYKFIISDKITTQNALSLSNNLIFLYVTDVLYCALLDSDKTLRQRRLDSDSILSAQQQLENYMFDF